MSLLQEQIEEKGSGIIDINHNHIKLTGFMSPERLFEYYLSGKDCRLSVGIYPVDIFDIAYVQDNALFIVEEDGYEKIRYQFELLLSNTVKYKDKVEDKNYKTKVYSIRKCKYTEKYNYKDMDKSLLFDSKSSLEEYFFNQYRVNLII